MEYLQSFKETFLKQKEKTKESKFKDLNAFLDRLGALISEPFEHKREFNIEVFKDSKIKILKENITLEFSEETNIIKVKLGEKE